MTRGAGIDRICRRRFARQLRALLTRRCTNDEFEDTLELSDAATRACYDEYAWRLYSDLREHTVSLSRERRREAARVLLFLYNDQPYDWPASCWLGTALSSVAAFVGRRSPARNLALRGFGPACWPFRNERLCMEARRSPPFLCGTPSSAHVGPP